MSQDKNKRMEWSTTEPNKTRRRHPRAQLTRYLASEWDQENMTVTSSGTVARWVSSDNGKLHLLCITRLFSLGYSEGSIILFTSIFAIPSGSV